MLIRATVVTHVGCVRRENQDAAVIGHSILQATRGRLEVEQTEPLTVAVLDGMGGHADGARASHLAALATVENDDTDVVEAIADANAAVRRGMVPDDADGPMGSTVVLARVDGESLTIANVGDSDAFRLDGDYLLPVSRRDRGGSGGLTASLGGTVHHVPVRPHLHEDLVRDRERLVLCTDGLSDVVGLDDIERILLDDTADAADALVDAAVANGAPDNVTVAVLVISKDTL